MIRLQVVASPNACDQIAFYAFCSFSLEVQINTNLEITIMGSPGNPQYIMLESLLLILMVVQEGDLEKTKLVLQRSSKKGHNFLMCKPCFS